MRQSESKIFEAYAKIAEESGLVSNADYASARIGSDDISTIELLYGVKPNGKDDKPIMEKAHPGTAVVSRSYDAMDGVVETEQQRQNITTHIALKTPDGNPIHRRYVAAHAELMKAVVRAGFKMDHEGQNDLMKLADSCAGKLEKKGIAWLPVIGIASLLGIIAAINNTSNSRQNVIVNAEQVINELEDLRGSMPIEYMIENIRGLQNSARAFGTITLKEFSANGIIDAGNEHADGIKAAKAYHDKLVEMVGVLPVYMKDLQLIQPQSEESSYDWWQKVKDVISPLIPNDVTDAINALEGLRKAIEYDMKAISYVMTRAEKVAPKIVNQTAETVEKPIAAPEKSTDVRKPQIRRLQRDEQVAVPQYEQPAPKPQAEESEAEMINQILQLTTH
jgi:hypothetical protein